MFTFDRESVDLNAPIIPNEGIGIFKLNNHIQQYYDVISEYCFRKITPYNSNFVDYVHLRSPFEMVFIIAECLEVSFHTMNGKLMQVTAKKGYRGMFNGTTTVGMQLDDFSVLEPSFIYDNSHEDYVSTQYRGISINNDPYFKEVESISVFVENIREEHDLIIIENFKKGKW
ncbi:hypothetical protein [Paenibacillus sp. 1001270B_150601_E10]|uniref:hypothetical protein n=1 Tax=Paenibacillus sp. 1001270B_150601_E10 TaxID=2787079 RepID=UPI00189FAF9D|nr:hypothetical protein [Paenibacillus sp. 1001270B_150601_E10]